MKKKQPILSQFLSSFLLPSLICIGFASTVKGQQAIPASLDKTVATYKSSSTASKVNQQNNKSGTIIWGSGASDTTSNSLGQFINGFSTGTLSTSLWSAISINQAGGSVTPGNAYWVRNTTGTSQGAYFGASTPIASPTRSNGVAVFDSDFLDNGGTAGAFGLGSSPSRHKGELISPSFSLLGYTDTAIALNFFCRWRNFQVSEFSASISTDGGTTWTTNSIISALPSTNGSTVEGLVSMTFPNVLNGITNLSNCKIKFTFDGDYYYAMIDDVSLTSANAYDLTIEEENPAGNSLVDDYEIVQMTHNAVIPIDQLTGQGFRFGANVKNLGFANVIPSDNATLNYTVEIQTGGNWVTVAGGARPISNITSGSGTAVFDSITGLFIAIGKYRVNYSAFISGDANTNNNSFTQSFEIVASNHWSKVSLDTNRLPVFDRPIFPGGTNFNRFEFGSVFSTRDGLILDSLAYNYYTPFNYIGAGSQVVKVYVYEWKDGVAGGTANRIIDDSRTSGELVIVGTGVDSLSGLFASGAYAPSKINIADANGNPLTLLPNSHYLVSLALEGSSFTSANSIWFAASTEKNYAMNFGYMNGLVKSVGNIFLESGAGSPSGTWLGFGADIVPSFGLYTSTLCSSLSATITSTNVSAHLGTDGSATVTGTGGTAPFTYLWSNAASTASASNLAAGTYTVTVTDANACTTTATTTITQPAASIVINEINYNGPENGIDTTEFIELYNNGSVAVDLTGYYFNQGITYTFPSMIINAGGYAVVALDSGAIRNVFGVSSLQWTSGGLTNAGEIITLYDNFNMLVDSVDFDDNSPWPVGPPSPDGGGPSIELKDPNLDNNVGSNWSISYNLVTGQIINGLQVYGTPGTGNVTNPQLVLTAIVDSLPKCNGSANGGASVSVAGGTPPFTYLWSNSATTASISGLSGGTYTVTVTDALNVTDTASVNITQPTILNPSISASTNVSCNGASDGTATISATGGTLPYSYFWNSAAGSQTTATATSLGAGLYGVVVSDANGCTRSSSVTITEPTALASTATATNASCNGSTDGTATVSSTGGTAPYTYLWSNAATTTSNTGLAAGTYTVTVTDNNGCTITSASTITEPTAINVTVSNANFMLTANQNGATYQWLDCNNNNSPIAGATMQSYSVLANGSYAVEINVNGCVDTSTCTIILNVGVNELIENEQSLKLFPNPNNGSFTLELVDMEIGREIQIYNVSGKLVKSIVINSEKQVIDATELENGVYFIRLQNEAIRFILAQ